MQLDNHTGITLSEAKATFENGNVTSIRADHVLGALSLVVCTRIGEKPIRTHRNTYKLYKSLSAILNDYKYITSNDVKSLIIR